MIYLLLFFFLVLSSLFCLLFRLLLWVVAARNSVKRLLYTRPDFFVDKIAEIFAEPVKVFLHFLQIFVGFLNTATE